MIHGHDEVNLELLKEMLRNTFSLAPVVLKELPDAGLTVIEKFERAAEECCHAVVLLTPDDHTQSQEGKSSWQPRQNVAFELGWFCARLGRSGITWLCKEGTVLPSDFNMVMTQTFSVHVSEKKTVEAMNRELSAIANNAAT